jgi:hypothetical protein
LSKKRCASCTTEKSRECFPDNWKATDGKGSYCRLCCRERGRIYRRRYYGLDGSGKPLKDRHEPAIAAEKATPVVVRAFLDGTWVPAVWVDNEVSLEGRGLAHLVVGEGPNRYVIKVEHRKFEVVEQRKA